ncbi:atypical/PI4K protein kinase [Puccinia sorghi]|uniref:1-phosphatidylinositol 4-kinase n=1 Tax=Puccinia sorghi TaxID=27349 RepID=A0A0L6V843_9BASI|nr:atypical/PI4K protein kinase [Puccinia sorghi]
MNNQQQHQHHTQRAGTTLTTIKATAKAAAAETRRTPTRANSTPTHHLKNSLFSNLSKTNTSNESQQTGGSGLLLRLFESEFFNVHLAISYLKTYHDSIGITYYLIRRLNQFPSQDVEFYWPQLCHLLISRPTPSFALESFIITKSQQSTHLALKTLWYLQASLSDLSSNPNTLTFIVCHRAFNRIQSIIFSDPLLELSTQRKQHDPRDTAIGLSIPPKQSPPKSQQNLADSHQLDDHHSQSWKHLKKRTLAQVNKLTGPKIIERVQPTAVGIGLALAGIASPQLSLQTGHVPIEQSRNYGQALTITSQLKKGKTSDNNSASDEEEELDHPKHSSTHHRLLTTTRPSFSPQRNNSQTSTRSRQQSMSGTPNPQNLKFSATTRTELTHNSSYSIDHIPTFKPSSHAELQPKSNLQVHHSNLGSPSSVEVLSPQWAPRRNPDDNLLNFHSRVSSTSHSILTAPILFTDHFPGPNLPIARQNCLSDALLYESPDNPGNHYALPTISHYPGQLGTASIASTSSPRLHTSAAISQSAPSLPDALSKFKLESRFYHPRTSAMNRNGKLSHQGDATSSPIRNLFNTLSMDPSEIPHGLLNQVLKSQSMRSQLDLITSLQDIATRLVVVPKKARLSALRAELTVLNHSLPKGCCLGMYCNGDYCDEGKIGETDSEGGSSTALKRKKCHQRIVRISPNESVVLNSADRAPFLIHVEVLEDHLDFDPNRRSNYEDLRKAIKGSAISVNESDSKQKNPNIYSVLINDSSPNFSDSNLGQVATNSPAGNLSNSLPPVGESISHLGLASVASPTDRASCSSAHSSDRDRTSSKHVPDHSQPLADRRTELEHNKPSTIFTSPRGHHSSRASSFDFPEILSNFPEEEMDLVDQVYGNDNKPGGIASQTDEDEVDAFLATFQSESLNLPAGSHNKTLDEQAWKRAELSARNGLVKNLQPQPTHHLTPNSAQPELSKSMPKSISNPLPTTSQVTAEMVSLEIQQNHSLTNIHQSPSSFKSPSPTPARPTITLDEYAERMRMAAIMLAQLSASQQPSQSLSMTPSSAAGMVVGGAIGLGAGFVGATVGAGLGAVVSRRLVGNGQTVITSPIGRKDPNGSGSGAGPKVNGQGSSGLSVTSDMMTADGRTASRSERIDVPPPSRAGSSGPNTIPRQKLLTPQQSQAIKDKIMSEMMLLEEERMQRMKLDIISGNKQTDLSEGGSTTSQKSVNLADEEVVMKAVNEEDPSGKMLSESWSDKRQRIRQSSPYGHLANWNLFSVIVKTGTDLRQEQIITQLINEFGRIWKEEECDVWVRYYRILVTGESTGLMETIVDAISIHSLKKSAYSQISNHQARHLPHQAVSNASTSTGSAATASGGTGGLPNYSIFDHYVDTYGPPTGEKYKKAQRNFMRSLVAYSIISYILQLKDRHNGNILIDKEGHIIHIDFGWPPSSFRRTTSKSLIPPPTSIPPSTANVIPSIIVVTILIPSTNLSSCLSSPSRKLGNMLNASSL